MKDSLKHLPKHKRDDLRRLTETIRQTCGDVRTAECAYKSLLLVYTNYTPYNHFLDWFDKAIQEVIGVSNRREQGLARMDSQLTGCGILAGRPATPIPYVKYLNSHGFSVL